MSFVLLRRRLRRTSGLIFALSLILFVFCLFYVSFTPTSTGYQKQQKTNVRETANRRNNEQGHAAIDLLERHEFLRNASWTVPLRTLDGDRSNSLVGRHLDIAGDPEKALESIEFLNANHEVWNRNKFGPLNSSSVDYVIIVQIHNRVDYLKYLVGSLSRARGIQRILLVFSCDFISDPVNLLIESIDFCRVIQIFFPYNIQLFPNAYPGRSPSDCPEGVKKSPDLKCADATHPDTHGNYRLPKLTQIKHHWWWKANYLFQKIIPKYRLQEKLLIMLEEDHLTAPDFLHTLGMMQAKREKICPDCEILCLGSYPKSFDKYEADIAKLGVEIWYSSKFNMGMAINAALWERISNCSQFFCNYDDYNWDWTMMQMSVKCLPNKMRVIFTKSPRVIHIGKTILHKNLTHASPGDCGVHTHRCKADTAAHNALKLFKRMNSTFFPAKLEVTDVSKRMLKPSKPNGGWGDPRDRRLCELNSHPEAERATEVLAKARAALDAQSTNTTTQP